MGKLAAQSTSVASCECSAYLQKVSVLPSAPTISSSHVYIDREPEITAKTIASHENEDSGDSSESSESDSAKHSDSSDDSNFCSGHGSDSDHHTKINVPSVYIGPPKSKSKQKPTKSSDVTTFVSDQGIWSILYLSWFWFWFVNLNVHMHSSPQILASQHGHTYNIKAIGGSSHHPKPI